MLKPLEKGVNICYNDKLGTIKHEDEVSNYV